MKRTIIALILITVCAVSISACTAKEEEPSTIRSSSISSTAANAVTQTQTAVQTTTEESSTSNTTTTAVAEAQTTAQTTTASNHNSEAEVINAIKKKYAINDSHRLTKKSYDGETEYYWEWADENGYRNKYDALRVIVKNGKITFVKRFEDKAETGTIKINKERAAEIAGGGEVQDILYEKGENTKSPRLAYKVVYNYCVTYVDTETGAVIKTDEIKGGV